MKTTMKKSPINVNDLFEVVEVKDATTQFEDAGEVFVDNYKDHYCKVKTLQPITIKELLTALCSTNKSKYLKSFFKKTRDVEVVIEVKNFGTLIDSKNSFICIGLGKEEQALFFNQFTKKIKSISAIIRVNVEEDGDCNSCKFIVEV